MGLRIIDSYFDVIKSYVFRQDKVFWFSKGTTLFYNSWWEAVSQSI